MGTRIHMVRHARPSSAWGGADEDPGLDAEGERQALAASQLLLNLPAGERPTAIVSSPLRRCLETAAPLAEAMAMPVEIAPALGEIPTPASLAAAERGPWLRTAMAGVWSDIHGDLDYERWRLAAYQAALARPGAAIFSHFVAINAVVSLVNDSPAVISFRPDYAAITTFEIEAGALRLVRLGPEAVTRVL